ncbi:MAG: hypothetical protein CMN55_14150 [Sneathiella sp.]|jgi:hypothetical protein|uniref:hypothetical protein n=2 Tax=Sneathiella sp. TaxID=1964365 RepID=UPI000C49AAD6|nr:hypothetical protein [Sneathiella sp.]MAL80225.1 hypothetical protein [Sneathiella sp.]
MFEFPLKVTDLETVPEQYHSLYQPETDAAEGFALDPLLAGKLDVSGLTSALEKERGAAQGFEKELKAWRALGPDPETAWTARETALRAEMTAGFDAALAQKDAAIAELEQRNGAFLIETRATEALLKAGGSVELLMPHIRAAVTLHHDAEKPLPTLHILDRDGTVRRDAEGAPISLEALVGEMRNSPIFARAFAPTKMRGSGMDPAGVTAPRGSINGHNQGALNARIEDIARGKVSVAL